MLVSTPAAWGARPPLSMADDVNESIYLPFLSGADQGSTIFLPLVTREELSPPDLPTEPAPNWELKQPGYAVEVVATGFQLPVTIAFAVPRSVDPTAPYFYVAELYGTIKVVLRNGTVRNYATGLLNFEPSGDFPGSGELGVVGLAVDPVTDDLFATLVYDGADPSRVVLYPKVVRLHSEDGGRTAAEVTTVMDMAGETMAASHQISTITIGPDQKLYVHLGDAATASTARNLNLLRGKILRINQDGTPPSDNPFYDVSDGITATDYIYAYGFRNPFGGAWRWSDQSLYLVENGNATDRLARLIVGEDYGWSGSDSAMLIHALYNWRPSHAPVHIAFVQPETFDGSGFPDEKMGHAYVTESGHTWRAGAVRNGKRIAEFAIGPNGTSLEGPFPLIEYAGDGRSTAAALAAGPDGLYFSDLYKEHDNSPTARGANILRIRYVGN